VAAAIFAEFFRHWKLIGPDPVAVTENIAVFPSITVVFAGWTVMVGIGLAGPDDPAELSTRLIAPQPLRIIAARLTHPSVAIGRP